MSFCLYVQAAGAGVEIVVRLDAGLRESTLGAGAARAGGAPGPDGGGGGRVEVEGVGVDEPVGLGDVATQADGELLARGAKGLDLVAMRDQLQARKEELMAGVTA